jgi:hypothetical protein
MDQNGLETPEEEMPVQQIFPITDMAKIKNDAAITVLRQNITIIEGDALSLEVNSKETMEQASLLRTQIKNYQKGFLDQETRYKKPFQDLVKEITAYFKFYTSKLADADSKLEYKQIEYHREQEAEKRRIEEKMRKEQEAREKKAADKGLPPPPPKPVPTVIVDKTVRTDAGTTTFTKVWTFELTDPAAVPREYCQPVEKLIREAVTKGLREIPGVKIYEETRTMRR